MDRLPPFQYDEDHMTIRVLCGEELPHTLGFGTATHITWTDLTPFSCEEAVGSFLAT